MGELSIVKEKFIHYINQVINNHKISHSYLIELGNYEEDMKYVYTFIKMILCDLSYEELQKNSSSIVGLIDSNNYPDIKIIEPDGSLIKKSQLIDLQKEYHNRSLLGGKRVYVILNAEKMNVAAANTMLKFLEEPDDDIIAFLITDNRYHVIDTVLSRCQVLTLKEDQNLMEIDDSFLELLKCIIFPKDFFIKYQYFLSEVIVDKDSALEKLQKIENTIICYLNYKNGISQSMDNNVLRVFDSTDEKKLLYSLSVLEKELIKLDFNVNYKLWLDSLFAKLIIGG